MFDYQRATSYPEAARLLADSSARALGGGTDLLVCIAERIESPATVVDVGAIAGGDAITVEDDGSVRIGAAARVHDLATDPGIARRFPMLARACSVVGSPALRHMGTLGGNLCQRPRCWYFRRAIPCLKNGGTQCPAKEGENQYHAILEGGPCYVVHPSDPAVALLALDATVEITSASGARAVSIRDFYLLPRDRIDQETILGAGELVNAVRVPPGAAGGVQLYEKAMQRGAWDFALVSIAAARRVDGVVRIALGGVAPRPWRAPASVEEDVASGGLDEDSIAALADRALYDAAPLRGNAYKVGIAASLLRDALRRVAA